MKKTEPLAHRHPLGVAILLSLVLWFLGLAALWGLWALLVEVV